MAVATGVSARAADFGSTRRSAATSELPAWKDGALRNLSFPPRPLSRGSCSAIGKKRATPSVKAFAFQAFVDVRGIDATKFEHFFTRRKVYSHEDWETHKSSGRHFHHFKTFIHSKVVAAVSPLIIIAGSIATAVVSWNSLVALGNLPCWFPLLQLNTLPFTLLAPVLSLLLIFRINSSYQRFDEARKMVGKVLNRTRDLCRQALTYMARGHNVHELPMRDQFLRHLQAFPLAYKHHFLRQGSLEADLRSFTTLTEEEMKGILAAVHRPNHCLQVMSECMGRCNMDSVYRLAMEQNFSSFADDVGGSERLFKTPIPLSYTRFTSRLMVLYHLFLPFALYPALGWITIPATVLHVAIFFGVEEMGIVIENPFPVLALDAIAHTALNNIAELANSHEGICSLVGRTQESGKVTRQERRAFIPRVPSYTPELKPESLADWEEDTAPVLEFLDYRSAESRLAAKR